MRALLVVFLQNHRKGLPSKKRHTHLKTQFCVETPSQTACPCLGKRLRSHRRHRLAGERTCEIRVRPSPGRIQHPANPFGLSTKVSIARAQPHIRAHPSSPMRSAFRLKQPGKPLGRSRKPPETQPAPRLDGNAPRGNSNARNTRGDPRCAKRGSMGPRH